MKWLIMLLYFFSVLTPKVTYMQVPIHQTIDSFECSNITKEFFCDYYDIYTIQAQIDTSISGKQILNVRDLDSRLSTTQDRVLIEVIDDVAPVINLRDNLTFIKEGFDPYECVERISDDSDFVYETYLQDSTVTIVATDIYGNMSIQSTEVTLLEKDTYEVMNYLGDNVLETVQNYLDKQGIDRENMGIGIKDLKTDMYYFQNEHKQYVAGSSMKLPLSVLIYDGIDRGIYTPQMTLEYKESHYAGGTTVVPLYYTFGDRIRLDTLLRFTLVPSDNIAANMLFGLLASSGSLQTQMTSFFDVPSDEIAVVNANKITVSYMIRVLEELLDENYAVKDKYTELVNHILGAYNGRYLKRNLSDVKIAHKCGFYNSNINDTGIVYMNDTPRYLISIYTQNYGKRDSYDVTMAERYIAKINQLVYEYYELVDMGVISN